MAKCTYCGRKSAFCGVKEVKGYQILEVCIDCEEELLDLQEQSKDDELKKKGANVKCK